jgi:hypothetical protein
MNLCVLCALCGKRSYRMPSSHGVIDTNGVCGILPTEVASYAERHTERSQAATDQRRCRS